MQKHPDNRFPIGRFILSSSFEEFDKDFTIRTIKEFPAHLAEIQAKHPDWSKTYRPQGWSAAQVLHHCADSHMNAFIRFKLALTENNPTIKPYDENAWANLPDYDSTQIPCSIALLSALHTKWFYVLNVLTKDQWLKSYFHPATGKKVYLFNQAEEYAWHSQHHLAHIQRCFEIK